MREDEGDVPDLGSDKPDSLTNPETGEKVFLIILILFCSITVMYRYFKEVV